MPDLNQISDLLLEWEEARRDGKDLDPAHLCRDWPEGLAELSRRIALLRKFEVYFRIDDTPSDSAADWLEPPALPGYVIEGELGRGGMGVVYRARQEDLDRAVAIKMLKGGANYQPQMAHRFVKEARLLARLKHENIVPVFEAKLFLGQPYFVMALVQGGSLAQPAARFHADPVATAALMESVARAVQYAHEQGVLHRDLKPANILLDEHGRPHITDFGIAKLLGDSAEATVDYQEGQPATPKSTVSADGTVLGTPPYMAPEQFQGHSSAITAKTDIWAMGVILYEILTGCRPFAATSMRDYKEAVCQVEPVPPRTRAPVIDRALEAIICKCLNKDPHKRYNTAAALADDLRKWRQGEAPAVYREPWIQRVFRRVKQERLAVAIVATLVVFGMIWFGAGAFSDYFNDPDGPVDQIEKKLQRKEKVTLIGELGEPVWFKPKVPRGDRPKTSISWNGNFTVNSPGLTLIELLRNPQLDRYIMTAQVQHVSSEHPIGTVGIYVGRFEYPSEVASVDLYNSVTFNDKIDAMDSYNLLPFHQLMVPPPPPKGNQVYFSSRLFAQKNLKLVGDYQFCVCSPALFKPAGASHASKWRTLAIKVTPASMKAYWEGTEGVGEIAAADQTSHAEEMLVNKGLRLAQAPPLKKMFLSYPQRGGLGLYVYKSSVAFRNVIVEPLID